MLSRIKEPVFLWNVFPLHPHDKSNQMSNRCHTAFERRACAKYMHNLVSLLKPEKIVAIGGDAHKAALDIGVSTLRVRHPSYGGQNDFVEQISVAYGLTSESEQSSIFFSKIQSRIDVVIIRQPNCTISNSSTMKGWSIRRGSTWYCLTFTFLITFLRRYIIPNRKRGE